MTKIEERLRKDLPSLADALIDSERTARASGVGGEADAPRAAMVSSGTRPRLRSSRVLVGAAALIVLIVGALALWQQDGEPSTTLGTTDRPEVPDGLNPATTTPEDPAGSDVECQDDELSVPTPQVVADGAEIDMDLLWVQHQACGYSADGYANLGLEPTVVPVERSVRVEAPSRFDASYTVAQDPGGRASDHEVPFSRDVSIDMPGSGCYRLEVAMHDGDLQARFVTLLEASDDACATAGG